MKNESSKSKEWTSNEEPKQQLQMHQQPTEAFKERRFQQKIRARRHILSMSTKYSIQSMQKLRGGSQRTSRDTAKVAQTGNRGTGPAENVATISSRRTNAAGCVSGH